MNPLPFHHITFDDSLWRSRLETNRAQTIPHIYEQCKQTGRIDAWKWNQGESNTPHVFWDSDVAKWMEAASYSLMTHPDPKLEAHLDEIIAMMSAAQMKDGYLNSHYIRVEPEKRWTNLRDKHELYCAGHLLEAAVAHHQATGKRNFLDVMLRYVDHIDSQFGREEGKRRGYCGHEEIELALIKLYRHPLPHHPPFANAQIGDGWGGGLNLAQYFLEERGQQPHYYDIEARARGEDPSKYYFGGDYTYLQAHRPVREQTEVVGHAVRAMYLYSAMTDLARETNDESLLDVCKKLWRHLVGKRLYITGGLGSSSSNEGFTSDYDLPDETAYAETCAGIGLIFWASRMLNATGDSQYADVIERVLYNNVLNSVSLDGKLFEYVNPLASNGDHKREPWYSCACCPPNIARLLASVGNYFYSFKTSEISRNTPSSSEAGEISEVFIHLYAQSEAKLDNDVTIKQTTNYPWDGTITITVTLPTPARFKIHLRRPGWCESFAASVNGVETLHATSLQNGYIVIDREWKAGDTITLNLEMPIRFVYANPNVRQMIGRVALQRGPIVYCVEGVDHDGLDVSRLAINENGWEAEHRATLLGGVTILKGKGVAINQNGWGDDLYRFVRPRIDPINVIAVPYSAWGNRGASSMRVWLQRGYG